MGVITRLAEEVVNMGDLAQAIVSLGRIAERRRGARADLIDATDTIAAAIREQLRSGDHVEIERHAQEFLSGLIYAPGKAVYRASKAQIRTTGGTRRTADVLLRIVDDDSIAVFGTDGPVVNDADDVMFHTATEEEREAFVHEAPAVVAAFRKLLEQQAATYEAAAKKAAKLTPR